MEIKKFAFVGLGVAVLYYSVLSESETYTVLPSIGTPAMNVQQIPVEELPHTEHPRYRFTAIEPVRAAATATTSTFV